MNIQPSLFDAAEGERRRDAGMDQAQRNADTHWKLQVASAIRWCAHTYCEFTTNEVWQRLVDVQAVSTHENRALGPMMTRASKKGLITKTDRFVKSALARQHGRQIQIWRSRVYRQREF